MSHPLAIVTLTMTIPNHSAWRQEVVAWYSGGPKPSSATIRQAATHGLPGRIPYRSKDRVWALSLAGFEIEDIVAAVPELNPGHVSDIAASIPYSARTIVDLHNRGYTPLEMAGLISASRPKVYYWLKKAGKTPNRRSRDELTARQRAQIVKAWHKNESMTDLATRFNVSYDQVRHAVRKAK